MEKVDYKVLGMHCVSCSTGIAKLLRKQKAIESVDVALGESRITVVFKETIDHDVVVNNVARLGYEAEPVA